MNTAVEWWAPQLHEKLSQGDIVSGIPVTSLVSPVEFLGPETLSKGRKGWKASETPIETKSPKRVHVVSVVASNLGIVISHSCDLDKEFSHRVLVAPLVILDSLPADERMKVEEQSIYSRLPLPEIPGFGSYYADLRLISSVPRAVVNGGSRVASMTENAVERLYAQLARFLMERDRPARFPS